MTRTLNAAACTLLLASLLLLATLAHAQTDACRQRLMADDTLRQLYARGDGMRIVVPAVPDVVEGLTAARVFGVARRKLRAHGLHDPDAGQWLNVSLNVGSVQYAMILSLRRWTDDLGYGLPGEVTVWGLGGGGYHNDNASQVLQNVVQHVDEFIKLYAAAQKACPGPSY